MPSRPVLAISQRVVLDTRTNERRDALDQRWSEIAAALGALLWPVPNNPALAQAFLDQYRPQAVILSGGNDVGPELRSHSSSQRRTITAGQPDAPERDRTETVLLEWSCAYRVPLLGVCRGMQALNIFWGGNLREIDRALHVAQQHEVSVRPMDQGMQWEFPSVVNSYHGYGFGKEDLGNGLVVLAECGSVVEAVVHHELPHLGIMWHPERNTPFEERDLRLMRLHFQLVQS